MLMESGLSVMFHLTGKKNKFFSPMRLAIAKWCCLPGLLRKHKDSWALARDFDHYVWGGDWGSVLWSYFFSWDAYVQPAPLLLFTVHLKWVVTVTSYLLRTPEMVTSTVINVLVLVEGREMWSISHWRSVRTSVDFLSIYRGCPQNVHTGLVFIFCCRYMLSIKILIQLSFLRMCRHSRTPSVYSICTYK